MQNGCERGWNGRGLRCSGCEKEVGKNEFFAEIEEWNGEKKVFCGRCFDRWLRE